MTDDVRRTRPALEHALPQVAAGAAARPAGTAPAEAALRERVARLEAEVEQLRWACRLGQLGSWDVDVASGELRGDEVYLRILGFGPHEKPTAPQVVALFVPRDQKTIADAFRRCCEHGTPYDLVLQFASRQGDVLWTRSIGRAVRDAQGRVVRVHGIFQDITEHVEAVEGALQKWRLLAESMPIIVWTARQDGVLDYASSLLARYTGIPVEQLVPEGWLELVHPDDQAQVVAVWTEALGARRPYEIEYRLRRFDGAYRWHLIRALPVTLDAAGTVAWYGSSIDIDDSKRLEQEARALAGRLAATMESITDGIFTLDRAWRFTYVNQRAEALLGRSRHELLGRDIWALFPEAVGSRCQREYAHCMATGSGTRFEMACPRHGLDFEVTVYPSDEGLALNFRDVTERRQAEQDRAARRAAEQASEAKSQFLARISHELRTPLNAILGFAQLMELDTEAPLAGTQADRLHKVHAAGRHLLAMINEILDLAGIESGSTPLQPEPVELQAAVRSSLDGVEPQAAGAAVRLLNDIGPGAPAVRADRLRLQQVLLNLVSNAVKYNRRGGWVRLSARVQGERVLIDVADTGRGLSDGQMAQLFQPFNRLGAERTDIEGAGLGLVIAKGLAQLMQGELHAARRPGGGSVFTLELPLAEPGRAADPAPPAAAGGQGLAAEGPAGVVAATVLYIEDDPVNALLVQHILALRPHCTLHEAADGRTGLALARQLRPDLVLTDMNLPDMTGYDVLQQLRSEPATRHLRCVALSADAMPENVQRARAAGFADFWIKPIDVLVPAAAGRVPGGAVSAAAAARHGPRCRAWRS